MVSGNDTHAMILKNPISFGMCPRAVEIKRSVFQTSSPRPLSYWSKMEYFGGGGGQNSIERPVTFKSS